LYRKTNLSIRGVWDLPTGKAKGRGRTTSEFARRAGIFTEALHSIEHSRRQLQLRTLQKIARALGVEARDLL